MEAMSPDLHIASSPLNLDALSAHQMWPIAPCSRTHMVQGSFTLFPWDPLAGSWSTTCKECHECNVLCMQCNAMQCNAMQCNVM